MPTGIPIDGNVLRRLREDRLWSQEDLAARARHFAADENDLQCGLDKITITKYERGARPRIGWRNLRYLVGALRPTLADLTMLLGGNPPPGLTDLTLDLKEDSTDRRHTLKAGLTAIGQLLLPKISGYSLPPVEELTAVTHQYRRWDQHFPYGNLPTL
ncbi:MAG: helix-turn-helix domain-containing protein [Egibacteraceae bacterium]